MDPDSDDPVEIPNISNDLEPQFEPQFDEPPLESQLEPAMFNQEGQESIEPQVLNPQKRPNYLVLGVSAILIVVVILILYFSHLLPFFKQNQSNATSKQGSVKLNLARGSVTSISPDNITVNVAGRMETFSIANTSDITKLISGSVGTGDAKAGPAAKSELKAGQEVLVIADIGSIEAKSIFILHQ